MRSSARRSAGREAWVEALVLDEDTGPAARWGQHLRVQLRRWLWGFYVETLYYEKIYTLQL